MKILFLITSLFLGVKFLFAQDVLSNIVYKTQFEKNVLTKVDSVSGISLFLAISDQGNEAFQNKIESILASFRQELDSRKFVLKTDEKRLKLLFNLTHDKFFKKYQEISNFDLIFSNAEYNCVSATALYALLLDHYNIPYSIKETPSHVYTVVHPDTKGIILESTAPSRGYYVPTASSIEKSVNSLIELKYVTKEEVTQKGVREVYNEFFYAEDEIDLKQLAGLQYYNESLSYFSDENYSEAYNSVLKYELLYPSEKSEYLKKVFLSNLLDNLDPNSFEYIQHLSEFANISEENHSKIASNLNSLLNEKLFSKNQLEDADSTFSYFTKNIQDQSLIKKISENYYLSVSAYYGQKSDYGNCLSYAKRVYELNDQNIHAHSYISSSIIQEEARRSGSLSSINRMIEYEKTFSFLHDNSDFQSLIFFKYGSMAFHHFRADDIKKGTEYLHLMSEMTNKYGKKLKIDEGQYGHVYAEAGAAYYRLRDYFNAKKILEKGLEVVPDHPEIKIRLEIVMDEF